MTKPLNVLYVSPNGFLGGAEAFVLEVSKAHNKDGPFKIINLFMNPGESVNKSIENGIETILLPFRFKLSSPFKLLKAVLFCRKVLKDKRIDIIHSTMPYAHIVMSLSSLFMDVKHVWFQHGPIDGPLDKIGNWFRADCIMFNSKFLVDEHHKLAGLKPRWGEKIIPLGIEPKVVLTPDISDLEFYTLDIHEPFIIGTAGRINRFKGYHLFIEAISMLKTKLDDEVWKRCFFPIIGGANSDADKAYLDELKDLASTYHLEDKVLFLGHKSNINDYLKAMTLFLHCSPEEEAISIVAAEAMLQSTLVIGSGIGDIIVNNKTGIECDTSGEQAALDLSQVLFDVLNQLNLDPESFNLIKRNALELIQNEYSKQKMIEEVETVYTSI